MQRIQRPCRQKEGLDALLGRAIARVSQPGSQPVPLTNVDKAGRSFRRTPTDQPHQMRVLAEQIVKKVERKYEERAREVRERERNEVEHRLRELRDEYELEREELKREVEREKRRAEEFVVGKDRDLRHTIELKLREKEARLEQDRWALENRLAEFINAREQFEFVQTEWRAKLDEEREALHLEKERIARKEAGSSQVEERARRVAQSFVEAERIESLERIRTLEMRITELTKKLADAGSQNFELRHRLDQLLGIENELSGHKDQLRRMAAENSDLSEKLRLQPDYAGLKEENGRLRQQLVEARRITGDTVAGVARLEMAQHQHKMAEDAAALKIRELRLGMTMMNDRLKTVSQERSYLRQQVKELRRRDLHNLAVQRSRSISASRRPRRISPSTSPVSSLSSDGDSDVAEIRKRLRALGDASKDLDATADRIFGFRATVLDDDWTAGQLDDFCRDQAIEETRSRQIHRPVAVRPAQVSDPIFRAPEQPKTETKPRSVKPPSPAQSPPKNSPKNETTPPAKPTKNELTFEEKLRQREAQRNRALGLRTEPEERRETLQRSVETGQEAPTTVPATDNTVFEGVDPVMARYMAMVMKQRDGGGEAEEKKTTSPPGREEDLEVPNLRLERYEPANDDFEW